MTAFHDSLKQKENEKEQVKENCGSELFKNSFSGINFSVEDFSLHPSIST